MTAGQHAPESPSRRIILLAAQAFALGLTTAWIIIPSSAIFLATYGSGLLPVTYICAAIAGVVASRAIATALRSQALTSVATRILAGVAFALLASWVVLWKSSAAWVSFGLLVLVPMVVPIGFMFVLGQAGMLLDVRSLKALYGRVVAGFALGFVAGGVAAPLLLAALGRTEHLLAGAAASSALFLVLVVMTRRGYPSELARVELDHTGSDRATFRGLLRNRYVLLIVGFQMLSAVESQWLDFLVFDRAAHRYDNTRELARFIGQFSAIAYGADILFLVLLAGVLLSRFGLRYGLAANATGVLVLVLATLAAASIGGSGTTIVFVLIVAARVTDLVFSDGTSRTSLSAAYQAVPAPLRDAAQAGVEGLAVPVAIGISGAALLALRAAGKIEGSTLPLLTGGVVMAWLVVAMVLYREYAVNLLASLRRRTLDLTAPTFDDTNSLMVVDRLLASEDERDVWLGLDVLTTTEHPDLLERLERLVADERVSIRVDALERLVQLDAPRAAVSARKSLHDPASKVRAVSVRVLGTAADPSDLPAISERVTDPSPEVRVAVAAARFRQGRDGARDAAAAEIRTLMSDPDPDVVNAALAAVRMPGDATWLAATVGHLRDRRTAGAAVNALVGAGDSALAIIDANLGDGALGRHAQELLARVRRSIGSTAAVAVLRAHVEHPDREVGLAVMTALAALGPESGDPTLVDLRVVHDDFEHATHLLRALVAVEDEPSAVLLSAALRDELELTRRRILAGLSVHHGADGLNRVAFQLAQPDPRAHALALEWLDVTLAGVDRLVVALLEPGLTNRDRLTALTRKFPVDRRSRSDVLMDLAADRDARWRRPWLKACALHAAVGWAASGREALDLDGIAAACERGAASAPDDDDAAIVHETLAWVRDARWQVVRD